MSEAAVQRQLAEKDGRVRRAGYLAGAGQYSDGDGEVIGRASLPQVGRREVDRHAPHWKLATGVANGGADPLPRLLDSGVGQADDVELGQAGRDVYLDLDDVPV